MSTADDDIAQLLDLSQQLLGSVATADWDAYSRLCAVTKAATLARVAAELGVEAADVIAFGDMPNDLPMLAWAGTSYAVANAHATVLAAADHVAPPNDADGVAVTLAELCDLDLSRLAG